MSLNSSRDIQSQFRLSGANDLMRYAEGEVEIANASVVDYFKNMTPALWQGLGAVMQNIQPLIARGDTEPSDPDLAVG